MLNLGWSTQDVHILQTILFSLKQLSSRDIRDYTITWPSFFNWPQNNVRHETSFVVYYLTL